MSKDSPIIISDSEESDNEEKDAREVNFLQNLNDGNSNSSDSFEAGNFVTNFDSNGQDCLKGESSSSCEFEESTPKTSITLNRKRLHWLSCNINLDKTWTMRSDVNLSSQKLKEGDCQSYERDNSYGNGPSVLFRTQALNHNDEIDKKPQNELLYPVKIEKSLPESSNNKPLPLQSDETQAKSSSKSPEIPVQQTSLERVLYSPTCEKVEVFDSPDKALRQTTLNKDSFSPNNSMTGHKPFLLQSVKTEAESARKSPGTPNQKKSLERFLNSPKKVGVFGSPDKPMIQTTLNKDSFSPKKLMTGHDHRIDDNSFHVPPLYGTPINGYGTATQCNKPIMNFMDSQVDFLDGIKEEELMHCYVDHLLGLVTASRKPSPELCFSLLRDLLLMSDSHSMSVKIYNALKRIQAIHPVVPEQMVRKLSFEFLEDIVERLEMVGCACKHQVPSKLCLKSSNALRTLTFLVDVMEAEVQRKLSPRKTIAFRLVSLQRNPSHIGKLLAWLNTSIKLCCSGISHSSHYLQIVDRFQRMIQLSISTGENLDDCAGKLAEQLITTYSQLQNLECRTLLLQTLSSHLVRSKFLSSFVKLFCQKPEESHGDEVRFKGLKQIIQNDLECLPLRRESANELAARGCSGFHRSEIECEEHAMIIAYSLQSYLFCHHKKLQRSPKSLKLLQYDELHEVKEPNKRHLSMEDESELVNMANKVQIFVGRLFSLCPLLTTRTHQLFGVLSNMKMWDPW